MYASTAALIAARSVQCATVRSEGITSRLEGSPVAEVFQAPELEGDERPEHAVVVRYAHDMLVDEARHRSRVEETAAGNPVRGQHLTQVTVERAAPPIG